ncbi:MAG TPA: hypothetical protein VN962_20260 [Polyangia bacterium]|nr:hypothetical protein [Polyangia bacterium]
MGRSALEIKLRETPIASAYGNDGPTPTPVVVLTERMVREAPMELPAESGGRMEPFPPATDLEVARRGIFTKSTMVGLCLTAFACGIITTVAFDHQRLRALERQVQTQAEALAAAAATPAPAAAAEPTAKVAAEVAAPAADPVVEQLPAAPPATPAAAPVQATTAEPADKLADAPAVPQKALGPRLTAARTPRPSAPRAAVRRRSTATAPAESSASPDQSDKPWVDPFAE